MHNVKQWVRFWAKCAAATWLVQMATGLGWLQALAVVALVLWGALEAFRALERLLEAVVVPTGEDDGGEGPDAEPPVPMFLPERKQQEWRS